MCFGLKVAPLLWGRLAATFSRLLMSLCSVGGGLHRLQFYMDDPLFTITGEQSDRCWLLSLLLLTISALGFKLAWHKGGRGSAATWIGVSITPVWADTS
eukprot:2990756-Amphidinium_carterae.1